MRGDRERKMNIKKRDINRNVRTGIHTQVEQTAMWLVTINKKNHK